MEKLIIGNLKMNLLPNDTMEYVEKLSTAKSNSVGVALPYTSLIVACDELHKRGFMLGAQNMFYEENGAYTGEVSAEMLRQCGCDFCLVGHSERRQKFNESNKFINKKIKSLLKHGIRVVLCVGENANERDLGKTKEVLTKQIEDALAGLYENELMSIIIAYEPMWAIGSGKTPTTKQVASVAQFIRKIINNNFSDKAGESIVLLYGGSVKKDNAKKFLQVAGIDGALIGGASNNASDFVELIDLV